LFGSEVRDDDSSIRSRGGASLRGIAAELNERKIETASGPTIADGLSSPYSRRLEPKNQLGEILRRWKN